MKPIIPTTLSDSTDRTTSRTNLTGLKSAKDFFFPPFSLNSCFLSVPLSFFIPSSFHPLLFYYFLLPSFIYCLVLIFVKIPSYLASDLLYSFFLPSFPFLFPFSLLPFFFFLLPLPLSLFPTGETIKPGVLKRPELDRVRPINISSRPVTTGD